MNRQLPSVIRLILFLILTFLLAFVYWGHQMYMSGVNPFPGRADIWLALIGFLTPSRALFLYIVLVFALFYRARLLRRRPSKDSTVLDD